MKKQMILLLGLAIALILLTGCGRVAEEGDVRSSEPANSSGTIVLEEPLASSSAPAEEDVEAEPWLTVDNTDAYESAYAFAVEEEGVYSFHTVYSDEDAEEQATWSIYVLEDAFDDAARYIPQAYSPCLDGADGTLSLQADSWVYCFCSVNAFTGEGLPEGSSVLQVDQNVQPVESGALSELLVEVEEEPQGETNVITSEDAFEDAVSFVVEETGMYTFAITNAEGYEDVTWSIYVLEAPFEDAVRYLPQAEAPALTGEGSLALTEGQVVYCFCSVNSFTNPSEEIAGASTLSYTVGK